MKDIQTVSGYLQNVKGDALPYRQVFEALAAALPFVEGIIVSSLPRGGLDIVQPPKLPDAWTRDYARELHAHDKLTWQVISRGVPLRARDVWPAEQLEASRFHQEFMRAHGFAYAAAAPLTAPVLEGYPGAVHLYRNATQGPFSDEDIQRLAGFAQELDAAILRARGARDTSDCPSEVMPHTAPVRQFILDSNLNPTMPQSDPSVLDERLRENLLNDARQRFEHLNGRAHADRVPLPDSKGDLWNFRVIVHRSYPALSDGPVAFFCLQPLCCEWNAVRPSDLQGDQEMARLLPAMKFMQEQFHRGPTLVEIAKTVHLSPFHFHRRFTELLGITPKHFLLDCQISQAKSELLSRQKELAKIATDCGFAHQSHFTSRFKQATGLTPTRWRRMAIESQRALQN